ncbi:DNA-binding winged helix-turn-helix (wHTH) protein [Bradyrhizobium sp. S3.12.5]|uniref:winged helix-turn-helix domain-containing protein n=1 Tax=Bradyrhizobium sp. S3.12.5 TaxID=3156386 RepID=UPI0033967A8E
MLMERSLDMKSRPRSPIKHLHSGPMATGKQSSDLIPDVIASNVRNEFIFGPFVLSAAERSLKRDGEALSIGDRALDLLIVLVDRAGETISHKNLIASAWPGVVVAETNLRVHICGIRKVLGDGQDGARYVSNVAGRGYCFVAAVSRSSMKPTLPQADAAYAARRGLGVGPSREVLVTVEQPMAALGMLREVLKTLHSEQDNAAFTIFADALAQGLSKALIAAASRSDCVPTVDCLKEALRFAREKSALVGELRSAIILARLLSQSGQREAARSILQPIYDRYTQGFEMKYLRDARALLVSLC